MEQPAEPSATPQTVEAAATPAVAENREGESVAAFQNEADKPEDAPADLKPDAVQGETTAADPAIEEELESAEKKLERLLAAVQQDRSNFEAWEALLKGTEVSDDIALIRKVREHLASDRDSKNLGMKRSAAGLRAQVFQDFLSVYPLCFGYWKKYAEAEAKAGSIDKAFDVYEQGIGSIPYECNLWTAYADFYEKHKPDDTGALRAVLKRAVSIVGEGYYSSEVWDKYIALEEKRGSKLDLADVYRKAIRIPLPNHSSLVKRFRQLINENELAAIVPLDQVELLEGASEVEKKVSYMALVDDSCKMTEREDQKRKGFEMNIRRPYFHTKPLDEAQLVNWHNYLTFEENEGDNDRIKVLYERCLIPCAQYETYWIRYARYCEREQGKENAQEILGRALTIFLPNNKDLLACYARFAERTGEIEGSRTVYQNLLEHMCPGSLNATLLFANFERRAGNMEGAKEAFENTLKVQKETAGLNEWRPITFISYAKFLHHSVGDIQGARKILERAMQEESGSRSVVDALINLELSQPGPDKVGTLAKIYKEVLSNSNGLSEHNKKALAKQYTEHMDMCGNADALEEADGFYWKFCPVESCYLEEKANTSEYEREASNPAKRLKTTDTATAQSSTPLSSGTPANASTNQAASMNNSSSAAVNGNVHASNTPYNYSQYGQAYSNQYAYAYGAYGQAYQGNYAYGSTGQYPQNGQYNYYGYYQ